MAKAPSKPRKVTKVRVAKDKPKALAPGRLLKTLVRELVQQSAMSLQSVTYGPKDKREFWAGAHDAQRVIIARIAELGGN